MVKRKVKELIHVKTAYLKGNNNGVCSLIGKAYDSERWGFDLPHTPQTKRD